MEFIDPSLARKLKLPGLQPESAALNIDTSVAPRRHSIDVPSQYYSTDRARTILQSSPDISLDLRCDAVAVAEASCRYHAPSRQGCSAAQAGWKLPSKFTLLRNPRMEHGEKVRDDYSLTFSPTALLMLCSLLQHVRLQQYLMVLHGLNISMHACMDMVVGTHFPWTCMLSTSIA